MPELMTITTSITLPKVDMEAFSDAVGYMEKIESPEDNTIYIPNPESRIDFVKRLFVERSVNWFVRPAENIIRKEESEKIQGLVDTKKEALKAAITIT